MSTDRPATPLLQTNLPGLPLWRRGKVRDVYDLGDRLLIVATDRISAFDVVLPTGIPGKGAGAHADLALLVRAARATSSPNHLVATDVADFPAPLRAASPTSSTGRSMLVRKAEVLPIECVVRGYLAGSGWKEYQRDRRGLRHRAAGGLRESRAARRSRSSPRRPRPRPATTRTSPSSDVGGLVGARAGRGSCGDVSARALRARARDYARGARHHHRRHQVRVRPAATAQLIWIDEVLTPDSSRFWPADGYAARARASPASTSSSCATTSRPSAGTRSRPAPSCRPTWWPRTRGEVREAFERLRGHAR